MSVLDTVRQRAPRGSRVVLAALGPCVLIVSVATGLSHVFETFSTIDDATRACA